MLAFSKLAAQPDIVGFLGSIRSTQVHAMAPDVLKLGKPVMIGGTDPNLTHMGNQWLFRFRPNDSYSGRVIADYGVNTLGKKKWAMLHSTDAFGTAGGKALTDALTKLGTPPVLDQGYANQSQDFTPSCWRSSSPAPTFSAPTSPSKTISAFSPASCASSASTFPGSVRPRSSRITRTKLAGPALFGTFGVADYAEDSSDASKAFGKAYRDAYKIAPDNQSSWPYDAITVLSAAINKAGSTDPAKIREAILATKKYAGAEGEYNFDQNGDGLHGYNVVRNEKGKIVYDKQSISTIDRLRGSLPRREPARFDKRALRVAVHPAASKLRKQRPIFS